MTGDGIEEVDLNIQVCCLESEEPEQEDEEIHHQPIDVIPNVGDVSNENLEVDQVLDDSDKIDREELDNYQEIASDEEVNGKGLLDEKILQCSRESKSQEKSKIDWLNILKIGTIGSGISSLVMYLWHKIIPSDNVDK